MAEDIAIVATTCQYRNVNIASAAVCGIRNNAPMDIERIRAGLKKSGKSQAGLARALRRNPTAVSRLLKGERQLKASEIPTVEKYLDEHAPEEAPAAPRSEVDFSRQVEVPDGPRDLPLYGNVKGGPRGEVVDIQARVATVNRPDYLVGIPNAFAMYVVGTSMEPRFRRGDTLFIHPGRPPNRGDEVVVAFADNTGLVKIYVGATDSVWEFEQLNPKRKLRFPRTEVVGIYFVHGIKRP